MGLWTGESESERDREREDEEEEETRSVDLLSLFPSDLANSLKELWPSQRSVGSALIIEGRAQTKTVDRGPTTKQSISDQQGKHPSVTATIKVTKNENSQSAATTKGAHHHNQNSPSVTATIKGTKNENSQSATKE